MSIWLEQLLNKDSITKFNQVKCSQGKLSSWVMAEGWSSGVVEVINALLFQVTKFQKCTPLRACHELYFMNNISGYS